MSALADRLAGLLPADRRHVLLDEVRAAVRAVLTAARPAEPAPVVVDDRPLRELGLDSMGAVALHDRLTRATGLSLPVTVIFEFPTVAALAGQIDAELGGTTDSVESAPQRTGPDADDPIAIVGLGCRFPGAASAEQFWELVAEGRHVDSEFPTDRGWDLGALFDDDPSAPGTSYVRRGGFLPDAADFDAEFFGIGPREAAATDPQQRLMLETAWTALEDAGIDPAGLHGEPVGVFVGAEPQEYGPRLYEAPAGLDAHLLTGAAPSVMSGRIAYVLGLRGPALTIDTACSASLVAVHLACRSLRQGEVRLALAGGVAVLGGPGTFTAFSRQRALAPDGRCKPFAAAADGTGFAEGVGVLVLERLSDARRAGHTVLAVIRGSAVNSDGASNGLTAPSGAAQRQVIRQALADAGLGPDDVDAVEAHGTGTTLGDPIEAAALLGVYGRDRRPDQPLWLGSVKSNIGHTQAAAGVAGVIKMVQAMRHGRLPRTLHVDEPTPHVDWSSGQVRLLREEIAWDNSDHPRRAGVSSFGVSGTNAHLILEEADAAPVEAPPQEPDGTLAPWPLSARGRDALRAMGHDLAGLTGASVADVGRSLAALRTSLPDRAVLLGRDRAELTRAAAALAAGDDAAGLVIGGRVTGGLAWLCTGQGSQRPGSGAQLCREYPVFADALDEACGYLDLQLDRPLWDVLTAAEGTPEAALLDDTGYAQPALFALGVALARLLASWGVRPDRLAGHSVGEITAAHLAGVLSLEDAAMLVAARGRLMSALPAGGAMIAVGAPADVVRPLLADLAGQVDIAAINEPGSVVLSGAAEPTTRVAGMLAAAGHRTRQLRVSHAFHSPLMEPMLAEFRQVAEILDYHPPHTPVVSTVTGRPASADELCDPEYWVRHVRQPVRFADAVRTLAEQDIATYLELGPDAVLSGMGAHSAPDTAVFVPALRRGRPEAENLLTAVATAWTRGASVDWSALHPDHGAGRVPLPPYPFQRRRFWLAPGAAGGDAAGLGVRPAGHPLLGGLTEVDGGTELVLFGRLSTRTHPWLADHDVAGTVLMPGTAFVELALHAGERAGVPDLAELTLEVPLALAEEPVVIQVEVGAEAEDGRRALRILSRPADGDSWTRHGSGFLAPGQPVEEPAALPWPPPDARPVDLGDHYAGLADQGYRYGPTFQGLRAAWTRAGEVFAEVALPAEVADAAAGFGLHPALLDAALHAVGLDREPDGQTRLPFAWTGVRLHASGAAAVRLHAVPAGGGTRLTLLDGTGAPVLTVASFVERVLPAGALDTDTEHLYRLDWTPVEAAAQPPEHVLIDPEPAALAALADPPPYVLARLDPPAGPDLPGTVRSALTSTLALLHAWLGDDRFADSRLVLLTRGATGGDPAALTAAPVRALVRSAQAEHPGRVVLADLDPAADPATVLRALAPDRPELAVLDGVAHQPALARAGAHGALVAPAGLAHWRIDAVRPGTIDGLAAVPAPEAAAPPAAGQVRVAVRAAGLNFRDVLIALGMYPTRATMGGEAAGVVAEVGPEVTGLAPGDRVFGLFDTAFGPYAVTDHRLLVTMPADWSFARAAAEPIAFCTAYRGLVDLAGLCAGERVLVHAGAGGVGMAAVRLAQRLGAEVFATASAAKWDTLRGLGLDDDHIASSRDLTFADRFAKVTDGAGMDVVLNALSGEFVDASLRLLPRGGRFVEMGKTDVRSAQQVAATHPGVRYQAFDLMDAGPERLGEMLAELARTSGTAAPVRAWDLHRAPDAFRHMALAQHVGKVVLTVPAALDPAGTVLVTGGTRGVGAEVARHLVVRHGVRHLLLVARNPDADGLVEELRGHGASVRVVGCDVGDRNAVAALLDGVPAEHPLTAVVHAAGVVDDAVLTGLTAERLDRVLRPKLLGAWHLHELTADRDLAAFVLFSSAAATFDGAGQANYAAANGFLEALARTRRQAGLPAVALAWGPWDAAIGMVSRMATADVRRMTRAGAHPLPVARALGLLDAALTRPGLDPVLYPVALDLSDLRERADLPGVLARLAGGTRPRRRAATAPVRSLADTLATLPAAEQDRMLLELVTGHAAAVLGHDGAAAVDPGRGFTEIGFDSLTAVEFRNRLGAACGLSLPATLTFDYPTPAAVAEHLRAGLVGDREPDLQAEWDRLAAALDDAASRGVDPGAIRTGLRALLDRWSDTAEAASLDDVTAGELFDILDAELHA
ncbi:SDR family NAD(P)-dependent oxidoreductase [Micromonospora sp. FIMYZ51]|uniref:SDR family NAD(P)-dependent oxidoreductase n=1 Tax=Micromonospora sp. FIMYZ51 TaxID=3051832 RepID=UPI00311E94D5